MTCEHIRNEFVLYIYGELSQSEEETIEQHLVECVGCREELRRERGIQAMFDDGDVPVPTQLLTSCRSELRMRLERDALVRSRKGWLAWLADFPVRGSLLKPAGALALVAVGFFSAKVIPTAAKPEAKASRVRLIEPGDGGQVRITLEETSERTIQGPSNDTLIQGLLLSATQDPSDPGLRAESVGVLREGAQTDNVRQTLMQVVSSDPNPGVRLKALEGLKPYAGQTEVRRALAHVLLNDDNSGLRTQVIDVLTKVQQRDMVEVFQQLMRRDDDHYIKQRSRRALMEMNASVEAF